MIYFSIYFIKRKHQLYNSQLKKSYGTKNMLTTPKPYSFSLEINLKSYPGCNSVLN
jgi:hypothetical protein